MYIYIYIQMEVSFLGTSFELVPREAKRKPTFETDPNTFGGHMIAGKRVTYGALGPEKGTFICSI